MPGNATGARTRQAASRQWWERLLQARPAQGTSGRHRVPGRIVRHRLAQRRDSLADESASERTHGRPPPTARTAGTEPAGSTTSAAAWIAMERRCSWCQEGWHSLQLCCKSAIGKSGEQSFDGDAMLRWADGHRQRACEHIRMCFMRYAQGADTSVNYHGWQAHPLPSRRAATCSEGVRHEHLRSAAPCPPSPPARQELRPYGNTAQRAHRLSP